MSGWSWCRRWRWMQRAWNPPTRSLSRTGNLRLWITPVARHGKDSELCDRGRSVHQASLRPEDGLARNCGFRQRQRVAGRFSVGFQVVMTSWGDGRAKSWAPSRVAPTSRLAGPLRSQDRPWIGRGERDVARVRGAHIYMTMYTPPAKSIYCG